MLKQLLVNSHIFYNATKQRIVHFLGLEISKDNSHSVYEETVVSLFNIDEKRFLRKPKLFRKLMNGESEKFQNQQVLPFQQAAKSNTIKKNTNYINYPFFYKEPLYKEPLYKEPTCRRPKYLKNLYY